MKYLLGQLCYKEWRKRGGIEQILVVANDDAHMRESERGNKKKHFFPQYSLSYTHEGVRIVAGNYQVTAARREARKT